MTRFRRLTRRTLVLQKTSDAARAMLQLGIPWFLPRYVVRLEGLSAAEEHRAQTRLTRLRDSPRSLTLALLLAGITFPIGLAGMLWSYNRDLRHMAWLVGAMVVAGIAGKLLTLLWARLRLLWELGRLRRVARKAAAREDALLRERNAHTPPDSRAPASAGPVVAAIPVASRRQERITALFDKQAAGYDQQWARMAPIREGLHHLLPAVFADLPPDARILCVGAGTGAELSCLAAAFPQWRLTAIEPSAPMLEECRRRAEAEGFAARCGFHHGTLETLADGPAHDGATCFLVSQFFLEEAERIAFFRSIAGRLRPGGILATSDLSADTDATGYAALERMWLGVMAAGGISQEGLDRMRAGYSRDVSILPPSRVATLLKFAGFANPVQFYQSGLIRAWFATRSEALAQEPAGVHSPR